MTTFEALRQLWMLAGGDEVALGQLSVPETEPVLPSSYRVSCAAQTCLAAAGLAAAETYRLRGGERQEVSVEARDACAEFLSERYFRVDGEQPVLWDSLAGTYLCGDDRWVRVHTNFEHHRDALLNVLGCADNREAVASALRDWRGSTFECRAAAAGAVAAMMRSEREWDAHAQGRSLAMAPIISVQRIGDAPPQMIPPNARPLGAVRVLDLTRIIAGPVAGRTLAAHGADVLRVSGAHLPCIAPLVMDTGRGKLSCEIDLRTSGGVGTLERLLREADIFIQGYRPGTLSDRGFSPQRLAELRPGIIYVSLSAYGDSGPWRDRRGFDSIVQTASGINAEEAAAEGVKAPRALPCQALDHGSGHLMAFAAMMALNRRMTEGGSWHVRVSLARTGRWLRDLGRLPGGLDVIPPDMSALADRFEQVKSGFGFLTTVKHAARLSKTPAHWSRPSVPLGTHEPVWPSR